MKTLKQNIKYVGLGVLIGVIGTTVGSLLTDKLREFFYNKLEYTGVAYATEMNTKYIPFIDVKFSKKTVKIMVICILNRGKHPQNNIHVLIENTGEIFNAWPDKRAIIRTRTNDPLEDLDKYLGKNDIDFMISRIPPKASYVFWVFCYSDKSHRKPKINIQSGNCVACWINPNQSWTDVIETTCEKMFQLEFEKTLLK